MAIVLSVTVHPSGEMAIVLGTFTYSRWKVCHIAYCYSKMLNRSDLFHWLPWSRMPKMCAIPQLVSDPFNPSRNKKIRVQPYCFIFLLSSFFLLGSLYFSFAFPLLVWFLSLSGTEKPCLLALRFLTQECNGGKVCYLWFVCKRSARYIKTQWYVSVKRKVWFRNNNERKVLIVSSLGVEQVRFWKIKPWGILHS